MSENQNLPVPLDYDRAAWNTLHGTELRGYNDSLTAEQAERIHEQYDIEVHVGNHGSSEYSPAVDEYEAVERVVGSMKPGDILFVELYDHDQAMPYMAATPRNPEVGRMFLDRVKAEGKVSAWLYALIYAAIKGCQTVYADANSFEVAHMERAYGHSMDELVNGQYDDLNDFKQAAAPLDRRREKLAYNIVKTWAVEHLDPAGQPPDGTKRRLVALWGVNHESELKKTFAEGAIDARFSYLMSDRVEKWLMNFAEVTVV